jgi:hypothetical protein
MAWEYRGKLSKGDRVRVWIYGENSPVKGKTGIVYRVDNVGMIHIRFADGQVLGVVPGVDRVAKIERGYDR